MTISIAPNAQLNRKLIFLFVIFVVIASALRFYKIDSKSLWYDEFHSIIPTNPSNSFSSVILYSAGDQPPLFFTLLYLWYKLFPYDEVSGKVLCAMIGILGVVAMYFLGKEISGVNAGLTAMFLTATNIFHIYYSQELRFYSLLFLLTIVSFLTYIQFIKVPSLKNQIFFGLASIGLLYTHYFGMVVVTSQALIFIFIGFFYKETWVFFLRGIVLAIFVLIAFTPWIPIILNDSSVSSFWIVDPGPLFFAEYFSRYFNGWWALSFKYILNYLLLAMILYYLWNLVNGLQKKERNPTIHHIIIIGWVTLTLLIPYLYTIIKIPMLVDRYTLITLPSVLLIISLGWDRLPNHFIKILVMATFIVCVVRVHNRYYNKFKKPEYRELSQDIIRENVHDYPVLSRESWHFNYFFRKYKAGYEVQHIDSLHDTWAKKKKQFWVILPQYHLNDKQTELLNSAFHLEKEIKYYQMNASLYVKQDTISEF